MSSLESIRREFPALERWHHFDSARKAPLPRVASGAIEDFLGDVEASGGEWAYSERLVEQARERLGALTGANPEDIAFTSNASEGINYVANGLDWREGDNVVITSLEHPANILPWRRLAERGVTLRVASGEAGSGGVGPEAILRLVDARTRVVAVSWVAYDRGERLDPSSLAEARSGDRLLVVDGIQGMGILDRSIPSLDADVFSCGAHKGLFGLPGSGFVYVGERARSLVKPVLLGRHSYREDDPWQDRLEPAPGARRYEYGNRNYLGISVLGATASWLAGLGLGTIERRIRSVSTCALDEARGLGLEVATPHEWPRRAGILTLPVRGARALRDGLRAKGYLVSAKSDSAIRLSFQIYNDDDEARRLIQIIADHRDLGGGVTED